MRRRQLTFYLRWLPTRACRSDTRLFSTSEGASPFFEKQVFVRANFHLQNEGEGEGEGLQNAREGE